MFQENSKKMDPVETAELLGLINPVLEGTSFDPAQTTILIADLPFYPGCSLLDIADYTHMPETRRNVIYKPGYVHILDYKHETIYGLNKSVPIDLTAETVADYVRFFFSFVKGKHGKFTLVEAVDDIPWREDPPPQARKSIGLMVMPITVVDHEDDKGRYILNVTMLYRDSLYKSRLTVDAEGQLEMGQEELLIEDIPVLDEVLGQ